MDCTCFAIFAVSPEDDTIFSNFSCISLCSSSKDGGFTSAVLFDTKELAPKPILLFVAAKTSLITTKAVLLFNIVFVDKTANIANIKIFLVRFIVNQL